MTKLSEKETRKLFLNKLITSVKEDEINFLAAETAYHFIMALVPFLIVVLNIVLMVANSQIDTIIHYVDTLKVLPQETKETIKPIIESIIGDKSASVLSIGLLVAIWSSSNAINSLRRALNLAFNVWEDKNFVIKKLKSIGFTLLIVAMILVVLVFFVFGGYILRFIERTLGIQIPFIVTILQYLIPIIGLIVTFSLFFKYAPDFRKNRTILWRSAILGGVITTVGWIIITMAYSFYVSNISNMNVTYGPLVGIFALFVWFYLSSIIIILSAEITSAYDQLKQGVFYS